MADELDSFFDEVDQAETLVVADAASTKDEGDKYGVACDQPPAKTSKLDHRPPRGVVVAAASSVSAPSMPVSLQETHTYIGTSAGAIAGSYGVPPPPPPPPPTPGDMMPPTTNAPKKAHVRTVAGKTWTDATLADWPNDDFRLFVGNLDPTVNDAMLHQHFSKYASLQRVRVIRDNKTNVSAGYGFVSLHNALECAAALREQDQTWLGGRPIRIKRSHWKDREWKEQQKKKKSRR